MSEPAPRAAATAASAAQTEVTALPCAQPTLADLRDSFGVLIVWLARVACLGLIAVLLPMADGAVAAALTLRGAGATFPHPIYTRWAADYRRESGVDIVYAPVGSGAGLEQIERGQVDFAASDVPLKASELQRLGLIQFPAIIGGVVPVVNISGLRSGALRLSGQVLADIYLGKVRKWNDRAILELNPELSLPSSNITVVHRADSSGTSYLWSEYLSRSNPVWRTKVGADRVLNWPVGVAANGNEGVAASVQRTRLSIGYVEYAYAVKHRLSVVSVRNQEGQFVTPDQPAFEAATAAFMWNTATDLQQLLIDPAGAKSWPITGASFILLRNPATDTERTRAVLRFFDWALHRGQMAAVDLAYMPMPESAVKLIGDLWAAGMRTAENGVLWPELRPQAPAR